MAAESYQARKAFIILRAPLQAMAYFDFFYVMTLASVICLLLENTWTKTLWSGQEKPSVLLSMITGGRQVTKQLKKKIRT